MFQTDFDTPGAISSLLSESLNAAVVDCGASQTVCGETWFSCFKDGLMEDPSVSNSI